MREEDIIIVAALLFCMLVMTTCVGVCSTMRSEKRAEVTGEH